MQPPVAEGPVLYDAGKCMGCRYCMQACPFRMTRYEWESPTPRVRKCILCYDKIKAGELDQPACTKACPNETTLFGDREALIEQRDWASGTSSRSSKLIHGGLRYLESGSLGLVRECLENGVISESLIQDEMRQNHVRHDAFEVLERTPDLAPPGNPPLNLSAA